MSERNERNERIEMKTHTLGVMVSTAWPMLAAWGLLTGRCGWPKRGCGMYSHPMPGQCARIVNCCSWARSATPMTQLVMPSVGRL